MYCFLVRESLSQLPALHSYLARWREHFFIIVLVFAELSWFSAGRRSHRTVLEKRPPTAYFLFWPHKHAHCSQVNHQFAKSLFSSIVSPSPVMFFLFNFILYSQHLLAQWMCIRGDYRSAMTHEKEALTAFTCLVRISALMERRHWSACAVTWVFLSLLLSQFGEDHSQTQCSAEFLSTITKQAVKVERSLRQAGADCTEQTVEVLHARTNLILNPMKTNAC